MLKTIVLAVLVFMGYGGCFLAGPEFVLADDDPPPERVLIIERGEFVPPPPATVVADPPKHIRTEPDAGAPRHP